LFANPAKGGSVTAGKKEEENVQKIRTITLSLPYKLGSVNCYLVETDTGFVLIDTGAANKRAELENELGSAGCKPGDLELIVLTHSQFNYGRLCGSTGQYRRTERSGNRHRLSRARETVSDGAVPSFDRWR
jgi:hypothetical protein